MPPAEAEAPFVSTISATGQVVPERWASLSLPSPGVISSIDIVEGDVVGEGRVLLRLAGREQLEGALAAARLEELTARQALDEVYRQEGMARAMIQQELATARDEVRKAEYDWRVQQEGYRASEDTVKRARANVVVAEERVEQAKARYDGTSGSVSEDAGKASAFSDYLSAKAALDSAKRSLNWYVGHPTEIQQAMLDADVAVAKARLAEAEAAWDDVKDGPDPDVLALAQARLAAAQAGVKAAQAAVRDSELRAPFAGTIGAIRVRPNEWAAPGMPLIDLASLQTLQVETTDLSEIDAARVAVGGPATITFDALPEAEVTGRVIRIAPKASEGSGVNYTVWIALDEIPEGLLWGMTAFVDIEAVR
ncbi:MAG TPA: HlyD family efflux transporter periplasmic adaptor subunit [Anaerolineales bacterium]|nr:HlyD family efflux transporter periplasmic adaptor subunit [Anaerolineales bacterium]